MRLTVSKKIGAGFCVVLILTAILGISGVIALQDGHDTALRIADDRIPRLNAGTDLNVYVLRTGYFIRGYINSGSETDLNNLRESFQGARDAQKRLVAYNTDNPSETLSKFLSDVAGPLDTYEKEFNRGIQFYTETKALYAALLRTSDNTIRILEDLIVTMTATQDNFAREGRIAESERYGQNIVRVGEVQNELSSIEIMLLRSASENSIDLLEEAYGKKLPAMITKFGDIRQYLVLDECRAAFDHAANEIEKFSSAVTQLRDIQSSTIENLNIRTQAFQTILTLCSNYAVATTRNTGTFVHNAANTIEGSVRMAWILFCVIVLAGTVIAFVLTRMIVRPLVKTEKFAQSVAEGNLDQTLDVRGSDEIGTLADALRTMVDSLRRLIHAAKEKENEAMRKGEEATLAMKNAQEAQQRAETAKRDGMLHVANELEGVIAAIASASSQLSAQIEQSNQGTGEVASRLSEAATAMNEMTATVQEVARNAASAAQISSETREQALNGADVVMKSRESTHLVREVTLTLKNDMAELDSHAKAINNIMGVISDIADQTNLLALNAAIEAARAGEAGRGFAVVADEVRKLAEKTMASTQEVSGAILAIQGSMEKSLKAMDDAFVQIEKTTELAEHAGHALEEIVRDVESASDQTSAIAAASEEQSAAGDEINKSITFISESVNNVALAMDESTKAVQELASQAQGLSRLVENMKAEA